MRTTHRLFLASLALVGTAALSTASIEELTLPQMITKSDNAVHGEIVSSNVLRIDAPNGRAHYFTRITIEGEALTDGTPIEVEITVFGGVLNDEEGAWYSEAPTPEDIKVGNVVVAFYGWNDGLGSNGLYTGHGGIYRVVSGPKGETVLGRGQGYAIARNIKVDALEKAINKLYREKIAERKKR